MANLNTVIEECIDEVNLIDFEDVQSSDVVDEDNTICKGHTDHLFHVSLVEEKLLEKQDQEEFSYADVLQGRGDASNPSSLDHMKHTIKPQLIEEETELKTEIQESQIQSEIGEHVDSRNKDPVFTSTPIADCTSKEQYHLSLESGVVESPRTRSFGDQTCYRRRPEDKGIFFQALSESEHRLLANEKKSKGHLNLLELEREWSLQVIEPNSREHSPLAAPVPTSVTAPPTTKFSSFEDTYLTLNSEHDRYYDEKIPDETELHEVSGEEVDEFGLDVALTEVSLLANPASPQLSPEGEAPRERLNTTYSVPSGLKFDDKEGTNTSTLRRLHQRNVGRLRRAWRALRHLLGRSRTPSPAPQPRNVLEEE